MNSNTSLYRQSVDALNEADTCRKYVVPKLQTAGWDNDPHSIAEQRYFTDDEFHFTLPDVLKLPPISLRGNVNEIIGKFGGADQPRTAVSQLQSLLYAA
jgi:hypothetical protein